MISSQQSPNVENLKLLDDVKTEIIKLLVTLESEECDRSQCLNIIYRICWSWNGVDPMNILYSSHIQDKILDIIDRKNKRNRLLMLCCFILSNGIIDESTVRLIDIFPDKYRKECCRLTILICKLFDYTFKVDNMITEITKKMKDSSVIISNNRYYLHVLGYFLNQSDDIYDMFRNKYDHNKKEIYKELVEKSLKYNSNDFGHVMRRSLYGKLNVDTIETIVKSATSLYIYICNSILVICGGMALV